MTQIRNTRPVDARRAIMTAKQERRFMNSFRDTICESCGISDGTIVAAHLNAFNEGGTGYRARGIVAGLCHTCHAIADGRQKATQEERLRIWVKVCQKLLRDRARAYTSPRPMTRMSSAYLILGLCWLACGVGAYLLRRKRLETKALQQLTTPW